MKELYTIKQGTKESVKCFDTHISYVMMRLATAFPHAMPAEQAEETREDPLPLAGYILTSSPPWPGKGA